MKSSMSTVFMSFEKEVVYEQNVNFYYYLALGNGVCRKEISISLATDPPFNGISVLYD
eukprot:UN20147